MRELITIETVKKDEESFFNALVETKGGNLPANIKEVLPIFEFTDFKAKAYRIMTDKLSKLDDQTEAYNTALRSGQQWGMSALYCQKRIGEITREMPKVQGMRNGDTTYSGKVKKLTEAGLSYRNTTDAERIANNPDILERVIEGSRERGEIPTKTAVLNTIRAEESKKYAEQMKERQDEKLSKTIPKVVSDHYEWVKISKQHLEVVLVGAKHKKFDPAGKNFMVKKHNEIRYLLNSIEEAV